MVEKGQRFMVSEDLDLDPGTVRFNRLWAACTFTVKGTSTFTVKGTSTGLVDIQYDNYGKWTGKTDMIGEKLLDKLIAEGKIVEVTGG